MSTAVAELRPGIRQLTPEYNLHDMDRMAAAMAGSGFFGFKTPDQALAIMLIAQANGQHPATAAQDYDVIQGKPAKKPQAMLRDFIASGGRVEWHQSDDTAADATFSHVAGGSIRVKWDMARANRMGLGGKDNYRKQPGVMFRWRCVSEGVRIVFPGATGGLYTPEEVADFEPSRSAPAAPEVSEADERKAAMERALETHAEAVVTIKEAIASGDHYKAAETWFSFDDDTKRALWVAPTKGGCFTTEERATIKDPAFRAAYYGEQK